MRAEPKQGNHQNEQSRLFKYKKCSVNRMEPVEIIDLELENQYHNNEQSIIYRQTSNTCSLAQQSSYLTNQINWKADIKRQNQQNQVLQNLFNTMLNIQKIIIEIDQNVIKVKKHQEPNELEAKGEVSWMDNIKQQEQRKNPCKLELKRKSIQIFHKKKVKNYFTQIKDLFIFKGSGKESNQLILNRPIRSNSQQNSFKLKIVSLKSKILVGVIDRGNRQTPYTNAATVYNSESGEVIQWRSKKHFGIRFGQGDTIQVVLGKSEINWIINQTNKISYKSEKISNSLANFYPFIQMGEKDDAVKWIQN